MEHWSGPGRALSVHLDRFEKAHRTHRWLESKRAKGHTDAHPHEFLSDVYRGFWLSFAKTYSRIDFGDGVSQSQIREPSDDILLDPENVQMALKLMHLEHLMLNEGTTYYVSSPLVDLVTQTAKLMTEPEPMFATDAPTPSGFVVFERPWLLRDLHPTTGDVVDIHVPIRAAGWLERPVANPRTPDADDRREKPGIVLFFYGDTESYDEVYLPKLIEIDPDVERFTNEEAGRRGLMPLDVAPWQYGLSWRPVDTVAEHEAGENTLMANVGEARQWMLSFFRLMWQEIIQPDDHRADRAERRRWDRAGRPIPEDGGVKVLRLRRVARPPKSYDHDDEYDDYRWHLNHRFIVQPFTRRQYYPSLGPARLPDGTMNPDSHRRIYIGSYIKGPEGAPLVLKHALTAVTR